MDFARRSFLGFAAAGAVAISVFVCGCVGGERFASCRESVLDELVPKPAHVTSNADRTVPIGRLKSVKTVRGDVPVFLRQLRPCNL